MHRPPARPRTVLAALPLIAVGLGLSACSGSDAEPNSKAESTPRTPTAHPSVPSSQNAEVFTREVVAAVSMLSLTGETEPFAALASPTCTACASTIADGKELKKRQRAGFSTEGSPIQVKAVAVNRTADASVFDTRASVVIPKRVLRAPDGENQIQPEDHLTLVYQVKWTGSEWLVLKAGK